MLVFSRCYIINIHYDKCDDLFAAYLPNLGKIICSVEFKITYSQHGSIIIFIFLFRPSDAVCL